MSGKPELIEVELLHLPVRVQRQAAEHHDALIREFSLIKASADAESLPHQLLALVEELHGHFDQFSDAPRAALEDAFLDDEDYVDLAFVVPREGGEALARLSELLDEADEFCRRGEYLVTLAAPPIIAAYRHWLVNEFVRQVRGGAPRPWSVPMELLVNSKEWPTEVDGTTATVAIAGELDLATAPPLRDHLSHLYASGVRNFVLDCSEVSFIDSVGLSVILALLRRCREEAGSLTIKAPSSVMTRTLEVAGLYEVLEIAD